MSIKEIFVSRYKEQGTLIEIDYEQLEIAALAILTDDANLINDLKNKVDLHRRSASELYGIPERDVTPEQRRIAKMLSFQLQYGAGAASMAKKLGIPMSECSKFIQQFYKRYPYVLQWQQDKIQTVQSHRTPVAFSLYGKSQIGSMTGRLYTFYEDESEGWNSSGRSKVSFKPTVIKNYPVQGFATGDVVPHMLGVLWATLREKAETHPSRWENVCLINTIHDSYLLDVPDFMVTDTIALCRSVLNNTSTEVANFFKLDKFPLELGVSIKTGKDWGSMQPYED